MVTIELQIVASSKDLPEEAKFQRWADKINTLDNVSQMVGIRVVDKSEMTLLNQQYRQKEGPTNVLSFPAELHQVVDYPFIGDVIICAPIVTEEAHQQSKIEESHWAHLTVHGILHLQGYDHIDEHDAEQMEALEIEIMQQLGFENPYL